MDIVMDMDADIVKVTDTDMDTVKGYDTVTS
jgi:hypothetical protein